MYSPQQLRSMIESNREDLKKYNPDTTSEDYGLAGTLWEIVL